MKDRFNAKIMKIKGSLNQKIKFSYHWIAAQIDRVTDPAAGRPGKAEKGRNEKKWYETTSAKQKAVYGQNTQPGSRRRKEQK